MQTKDKLRKKYLVLRKKKYFEISEKFFSPLIKLLKKKYKKKIKLSSYFPASYEVNTNKLLNIKRIKKIDILLPVLGANNKMNFYKWKKNDILKINKYGMLEPKNLASHSIPDVMLVPLLAFDKNYNRLGYGKGYYDRYLNKYLKKYKKILTIGIAFSFQKFHKIPVNENDVKLKHILTEKGLF